MRAAITEPGPPLPEYGPVMSAMTPTLTTLSEICACAGTATQGKCRGDGSKTWRTQTAVSDSFGRLLASC